MIEVVTYPVPYCSYCGQSMGVPDYRARRTPKSPLIYACFNRHCANHLRKVLVPPTIISCQELLHDTQSPL